MKFYTLYFRNYIFLFILFIFTMLLISVTQSKIVATASSKIYGMADIPVGKNTKEPMGQFTISPVLPDKSHKKVQQKDIKNTIPPSKMPEKPKQNNKLKTTLPSNITEKPQQTKQPKTTLSSKIPEKSQQNRIKKTLSSDKPNITLLPSFTPENDKEYIFLSDYFLHLSVGDTYTLGISFISKEDAVKNGNINNQTNILDKIDKNLISCNIKETNTNIEEKENKNKKINDDKIKNKRSNKITENKILSVKDNCIAAEGMGIAVVVFYLKSNPDIKTSCTVRVTEN